MLSDNNERAAFDVSKITVFSVIVNVNAKSNLESDQKTSTKNDQKEICRTFENRHTLYKEDIAFFRTEYPFNMEMQTKWKAFVRKITSNIDLSFALVAEYLQAELKPYWDKLKPE